MKQLYTCLFLIVIVTSCLPTDKRYSIWIKNNSDEEVYFVVSNYSDTLLPQTNKYVNLINANDRMSIDSDQPWEEVFSINYPKDTLQVFYFNVDTINEYNWDIIRDEYKIISRSVYSKDYLIHTNWTITYP